MLHSPQILTKRHAVPTGSVPFSITNTDSTSTVSANPYSFATRAIGAADSTRIVVVVIGYHLSSGATPTITAVTVAGISATQATGAALCSINGECTDIWYAAVPSGTTGTIAITMGAATTRAFISIYSIVGTGCSFSAGNSATQNPFTTVSASVTVPNGGGAVAVGSIHNASNTVTGTNQTIDVNNATGGTSTWGSGHDTSHTGSTSYTFTFSGSANDVVMSVAAFNP